MEVTVHGNCCCDDQDSMTVMSPDRMSLEVPCCETTIELTVAQDADRSAFASSRAERVPDGDPLPAIALHSTAPIAVIASLGAEQGAPAMLVPGCVGTDTYLLTQRLRI